MASSVRDSGFEVPVAVPVCADTQFEKAHCQVPVRDSRMFAVQMKPNRLGIIGFRLPPPG